MRKQSQQTPAAARWLLVCLAVFSLAATTGLLWAAATGPSAPPPWDWSQVLGPDGQSAAPRLLDAAPTQPAETFTSRAFWIVLGLVVLGSLVLRADFPGSN